jgi:hypothetical protein
VDNHVNLDFIDLLYAVPVAALATRIGETHLEHVGPAAWFDIFLALIALTLGWIGHHNNRQRKQKNARDRELPTAAFTEWTFTQFIVEAGVIGVYFALSTRLSLPSDAATYSAQLHWKASWLLVLFALYVLWDLLDILVALTRAKLVDLEGEEYKYWAKRAACGGMVSLLFAIVFASVRYSAPAGAYSTIPFDVACIVLLYCYRVSQQEWLRAFQDNPRRPWQTKRGAVTVAGVSVLLILLLSLALSGALTGIFSRDHERIVIAHLQPSRGSTSGGTRVTVQGEHFEPSDIRFRFRAAYATDVHCPSDIRCTLQTPAGRGGLTYVIASLHGSGSGASRRSEAAQFTYMPPLAAPHVQVELTPYGRLLLRRRLGAGCRNDDLFGRIVAGPTAAPVVLTFASAGCRRLRLRLLPDLGTLYVPAAPQ